MSTTTGIRCGNCHATHATKDAVKACFMRKYDTNARLDALALRTAALAAKGAERERRMRGIAPVAPKPAPVAEKRLPCESGPAGIGCDITGIPGVAGTGWNGQKFTNLFECPRCHGKGFETTADRKRNLFHDDRYMAERIMADFR